MLEKFWLLLCCNYFIRSLNLIIYLLLDLFALPQNSRRTSLKVFLLKFPHVRNSLEKLFCIHNDKFL